MNQGIHTVDLLQWFAGPVTPVCARAANVLCDVEVEDTASATLQFASGAVGVIAATTTSYPPQGSRIEIHGEQGTIIFTDAIEMIQLRDAAVALAFSTLPDGHRAQIRDMALAVLEDREPIVPGREGRVPVESVLGRYPSAGTYREIAPGCLDPPS